MSAPAPAPAPASAPATGSTTASGPTVRSAVRGARGPVLVALLLAGVAALAGVLSATGAGGRLDPDSAAPSGSRAVSQVLRAQGVPVQRVDTVEAVEAADASGVTVVVPVPAALAPSELERLARLEAGLVVVGADDEQLSRLDLPAEVRGEVRVQQRDPACRLPTAVAAGDVDLGGLRYRASGPDPATGCYASGGEATLLHLPAKAAVLLGAGDLLTNDRLDEHGNAALALGLLGERPDGVLWLVPRPGRAVPEGDQRALSDLLPDGLLLGLLQLLLALGVLALWRARRLGRVVEEPLPVVVRASEAVEGRGRLYRAARARDAAAAALRTAARDRLARRVGLVAPAGREALVSAVTARTGGEPAACEALLYGGPPPDDAALVRLVDDLHALEATLSRTP